MADPFSAVAGAASIVDVAVRSCNTLYDSICYIRDAPGLTLELQQTVQSIQSILQSLNALVARYRQSQVFTAQLHIPDAVSHEIVAIKKDLDLLSSRLPAPHTTREVRTGLKWIRDRRRVEKLVLKLQRHQISLTLALQSPLQQMAANSHENVLLLHEEIERRHLHTKDELKANIDTMGTGLHDALRAFGQKVQESLAEQGHLKRLLESQHLMHHDNQATVMNDIRAIGSNDILALRSSLSDLSIRDAHVRTDTTVKVPTEATVARVIRAELRRVLKPTIEQCLDTFKASTDDQSRSMLKKIDEMVEHFGQVIRETSHSCSSSGSHSRSDAAIDQKCIQDDTGATGQLESAQMGNETSVVSEIPNGLLVRRSKHWRRSKVFRWVIGTLWVTVTSTHTTSNVSYEAASGGAPDACCFLLAMGADPLVTNSFGLDLITVANAGVLRPLQPWADDLFGDCGFDPFSMSNMFLQRKWEAKVGPDQIETCLHYIAFLKDCGFGLIGMTDEKTTTTPLHHLCYSIPTDDWKIPIDEAELALRIALELSGEVNVPDMTGQGPLLSLFLFREWLLERRRGIIEFAALLLRYGADPCTLDFEGFSVLDVADSVGSGSEFLEALELAGFDIGEVAKEIEWRQSIFDDGYGKSTAVDDEGRAPRLTEGLSQRRVVVREGDED
ncbi:MAG: hypothetical protein Q9207_008397 [Kuettlingeria erythrocarpa]